jgi:segregation and condensation protein A
MAGTERGDDGAPREGAYRVELPFFEGPLDLLLHLVKTHELDILDIPIAFITEKYLEYIALMRSLQLDVAAEYLLMAATLAHIKSRMLVPVPPALETEAGETEPDPRMELVRRLLEYQRYKEAAEKLVGLTMLSRDVFLRGSPPPAAQGEAPLAEMEMWRLLEAFKAVLERSKFDVAHEVTVDRISVTERIGQLSDLFARRPQVVFEDLFDGQRTRYEVVVTFLAILEMTRLKMLRLYQAAPAATIHISVAVRDEEAPPAEPGAAEAP